MLDIQSHAEAWKQEEKSGYGKQMMIVGFEGDLRDAITYALSSYGFRLNFFKNNPEALANMLIEPLDGIIIDCDSVGTDGTELIRWFRRQFPLAIIIGMSEEDKGAALLQAGANDFLQKNFVPYRLAMMFDGGDILS